MMHVKLSAMENQKSTCIMRYKVHNPSGSGSVDGKEEISRSHLGHNLPKYTQDEETYSFPNIAIFPILTSLLTLPQFERTCCLLEIWPVI